MSSTFDVVIESDHPRAGEVSAAVEQSGGKVYRCQSSDWSAAISEGQSASIVLVDRRAEFLPADWQQLASRISQFQSPIVVKTSNGSQPAERYVPATCPPAVAVCWTNPARSAAICIQRSQIDKLPAIQKSHPEPLWDWLIRATIQCHAVVWESSGVELHGWHWPTEAMSRVPVLRPSSPHQTWLVEYITSLKPSQLVPEKKSEADSVALKAGLLQWHDGLNGSHELSQSVEGLGKHQSGDYWHAIMHRREPDYGNAKYWFRQLKTHPVFTDLLPLALEILDEVPEGSAWQPRLSRQGAWDPFAFVDLCEACADKEETPLGWAARQIQAAEMQLLLAATYRDASGGG